MKAVIALQVSLVFLLCLSEVVWASPPRALLPEAEQMLVQYDKGIGRGGICSLKLRLTELGFGLVRDYKRSGLLKVQCPDLVGFQQAASIADDISGVLHCEPVYECKASSIPNDEWYWLQWNMMNVGYEQAWEQCLKDAVFSNAAVIAVLDTGVAYEDHQDSSYSYERAPDFAGVTFVDGYDVIGDDYHPNDDNGHGTWVCGIAAQATNNNIGVASIGFGCRIMPVKVLNEYQCGDTASLVEGMYYAVDNGADVLNCSLGFAWYYSHSQILEDAVSYATQNGVLIVGSAGNRDLPYVEFPAAYSSCLAVGAASRRMSAEDSCERADYSCYGVALDLVAPGGTSDDADEDYYPDAVLAQSFDGGDPLRWDYWWADGTSAAAAHVSAVAGVLMSIGFDREQAMSTIKATASRSNWAYYLKSDSYYFGDSELLPGSQVKDDAASVASEEQGSPGSDSFLGFKMSGFDCEVGYGLLNAGRALSYAMDGLAPTFAQYEASVITTAEMGCDGQYGHAHVSVVLQNPGGTQTPAAGVTVYGYWKGSVFGSDSEVTGADGCCVLDSSPSNEMNPTFEFVVTNIVKSGTPFAEDEEISETDIMSGDAMIVVPIRATGPNLDPGNVDYVPWYIDPSHPIY